RPVSRVEFERTLKKSLLGKVISNIVRVRPFYELDVAENCIYITHRIVDEIGLGNPFDFRNFSPSFNNRIAIHRFTYMSKNPVKVFEVPENIKKANPLGLRVLCIDNGGIRSFSAPYMLEQIMLQARHLLKVPEGKDLRPCDVFDLICGTSTGGWIALMLGRLGMTVRQCIAAYEEIMENVFLNNASSSSDEHAYSAKKLEETTTIPSRRPGQYSSWRIVEIKWNIWA
ncbi:FabD/lysophospholipase-like protein, partial [Atractiella rhizophila]